MKARTDRGFTLIELLVAVVLMLILVGAVVAIFNQSSNIFTISEAKMDIFQNARIALDTISREIASMQVDANNPFVVTPPDSNDDTILLEFTTITSFENTSGRFKVAYRMQQAGTNERWNLVRQIFNPEDDPSAATPVSEGIIAQFLLGDGNDPDPKVRLDQFAFDGTNWGGTPINAPTTFNDPANLPPAVRITFDMTDRLSREVRTIGRTFWIATNEGN